MLKNNHGMTLMETIIAIMILSIAGLMILSGFSAVIKTMGRSASFKNDSDILLSYAEKSGSADLNSKVSEKSKKISYSIITSSQTRVDVNGTLKSYQIKGSNLVTLQSIQGKNPNAVKDTIVYADTEERVHKLLEIVNSVLQEYIRNNPDYLEINGYNLILKAAYGQMRYPVFEKTLLPSELKQYASEAKPFYIKACFPWEYRVSKNGKVTHGGMLVYLNQDGSPISTETADEILHIIYDYNSDIWYYCGNDDYVLKHDQHVEIMQNQGSVYVKDNPAIIMSWDEMIAYIKNSKDWKIMNIDASIESDFWQTF